MSREQIIIGVDPGTLITGYGVIRRKENIFEVLEYGSIRPPVGEELNQRYLIIHQGIEQLLLKYAPCALAVETQYVNKNVHSALKLSNARLAVILAAQRLGIAVSEYSPTAAKKAVTGVGSASKEQIQKMIQKLFFLKELPPPDAADGLGIAFCHANKMGHKS